MIFDCFLFFQEHEILDLRLALIANSVSGSNRRAAKINAGQRGNHHAAFSAEVDAQ